MKTNFLQNNSLKNPILRFKSFGDAWEQKKLNNLARIYDGTHQTPNYVKEGVPFYSVEHVTANDFSKSKFVSKDIFEKENKKVKIEKGDILMTRIGDIGTARLIDWNVRASFYVSLALIKQSKKINSSYLSQYIKTTKFQKELWRRTIHVAFPKKINLGEIGECVVAFPSLPEQEKISSFLGSVDEWINNVKKQKKVIEKYKKGMMQKIFSQEVRFKDGDGKNFPNWEEKKLGEYLILSQKKNKNSEISLVLSVSNKKGFIAQTEQFEDYRVASREVLNYRIVEKGDFAYNPSRINVGSIACLKNFDTGIVSPMYVVFKLKDNLDEGFFENILKTHYFNYLIKIGCSGSVRDTLNFEDMARFKLQFPNIKEQQKIANFLTSLDKVIEAKQQQITLAEDWKKGLMQGLFI